MNCPNTVLDQRHLLECKYLTGKSEIISYIPTYEDLFRGDIEDQIYISRISRQNLSTMKAQRTMWTGDYSLCSTVTWYMLQLWMHNKKIEILD